MKKGFVHIVEISFAILLLSLSVYLSLSVVDTKTKIDRSDLFFLGENLAKIIENSTMKYEMLSDREKFINKTEELLPSIITYGIRVKGTAKPIIRVACANCSVDGYYYAKQIFTPMWYNGRWVNFSVSRVEISTLKDTEPYDVLFFINYTNFDENTLIQDYLKHGGKVFALTKIYCYISGPIGIFCDNFTNMDKTFSFTIPRGISKEYQILASPENNTISKYFVGLGFYIKADELTEDGKHKGYWYIWKNKKEVNITQDLYVEIEGLGKYREGDIFVLNPNSENSELPYENIAFKIKKVYSDFVYIQTLNYSFPFVDYIENKVIGPRRSWEIRIKGMYEEDNVLMSSTGDYSLMIWNSTTKNAVWMSYFPYSDEYVTLLKSAIVRMTDEFDVKTYFGTKEKISIPFVVDYCCDIPEAAKIIITLGYKY